jgi:hypothetical protein
MFILDPDRHVIEINLVAPDQPTALPLFHS